MLDDANSRVNNNLPQQLYQKQTLPSHTFKLDLANVNSHPDLYQKNSVDEPSDSWLRVFCLEPKNCNQFKTLSMFHLVRLII